MRTTQGLSIMIKDSWSHSPVSSHAVRECQLLRYVKCILFVIWFIFVCYRTVLQLFPFPCTIFYFLISSLNIHHDPLFAALFFIARSLCLSLSLSLSLFLFIQILSLVFSSLSQIFPPLVSPLPLSLKSNFSLFPSMWSTLSLSHAR